MNALRKSVKCHILCCLLLLAFNATKAQLTAGFSANNLSGCAPIVVQFTDQSAGNPTQWSWDLGNGTQSTLQNPSATYFNPGTYNVKLVVKNAAGTKDSLIRNQYITVYASPQVSFTASDTAGCAPLNVQFWDGSTAGSGSIATYSWDFGDGITATTANPFHQYTAPGSYSVTLRLVNSFGCTKTISRNQYINVGQGVQAGFTNTISGQCTVPVTANFTNTSTGSGTITYSWNFGDGGTSALANPVHTYSAPGSYTVTLIAVSSQGCRDTLIRPNLVSIGTLNTTFTQPSSVCVGESFSLQNTSTPQPASSVWSFGDGTFSNSINPVKVYASAGTFTIKLVNSYGGCVDSTTRSIQVKAKPTASFTAATTNFCNAPATVNFTNTSIGGISYQWFFGDGASSTQSNPTHTYSAQGDFTVTLVVTNANGCTDTLVKTDYIKIHRPQISISGLPQSGCNPVSIQPIPTIVSATPIVSYLWNFGDGATSTAMNPTHSYATAGIYTVKLFVTTADGCVDSLVVPAAATVGNLPVVNFSANPTNTCAFSPIQFTDLSTANIDHWFWQFGDGGTATSKDPVYAYSDTGYFNVTLKVWSNGCSNTITLNNIVHIKPPIANFAFTQTCANKYQVSFTDKSIGAATYHWDFGDGTSATVASPQHIYATTGTYNVILTVTNDTCSHSKQQVVTIVDENARFIADSVVCKNSQASFTAGANAANITQWAWSFGDGNLTNTPHTASHKYTTAGTYLVGLTITDLNGCTDTKTDTVKVYGPTAAFAITQPVACLDTNRTVFSNTSSSDGIHAIAQWTWNYGDGTIDTNTPPPYIHSYIATGSYTVSLKVIDSYGCIDSLSQPAAVIISKPSVQFSTTDTLSCPGSPIQFFNSSSGNNLSYNWSFGDGNNSALGSPAHPYSSTGIYSVSLNVIDQYGCKDTMTRTNYITIVSPKALFSISDSVGTCPPLNVAFTNNSVNAGNIQWDFGDGNTSAQANPSHYYTLPGTYFAKLTVTSPGGCVDTFIRKIVLRGPKGTFTYAPLTGCSPLTINFTAHTYDNLSFIWDYSDGATHSGPDSVISHTYTTPGNYLPKMILVDASGCTVPILGTDTVHVKNVVASYTSTQVMLCDSGYVNFNSTSTGNDVINNYSWNFGDGTTGSGLSTSHHYSTPGVYQVRLNILSQAGCTSTSANNDTISVYQSPKIHISGDTAQCIPAQFTELGVIDYGTPSSLNWSWDFGNGQVSNNQNPSLQTYTAAGSYLIKLVTTDNHGCKDSVTKTIFARPLPTTNAGIDLKLCEGAAVTLSASGALQYSWQSSPYLSCTNCAAPSASPVDTTSFIVTGTNAYGCSLNDTVQVNVRHPFSLTVSNNDTICVGKSVLLEASGADTYSWLPASTVDNPTAPRTLARPTNSVKYSVIAKDRDNCFTDTGFVSVKVWSIPTVTATASTTIVVGTSTQLNTNASSDVVQYSWTPTAGLSCSTCPNPVAKPKQDTKYTVQVMNGGGCVAQAELDVFVTCGKGNLFIPNTFSPNGDGNNDVFYPRGVGIGKIKSLRIFNRWGEQIFERTDFDANDISAGWDGRFKGSAVASDVYIYACEVVCENNELLLYKGDITLLK